MQFISSIRFLNPNPLPLPTRRRRHPEPELRLLRRRPARPPAVRCGRGSAPLLLVPLRCAAAGAAGLLLRCAATAAGAAALRCCRRRARAGRRRRRKSLARRRRNLQDLYFSIVNILCFQFQHLSFTVSTF